MHELSTNNQIEHCMILTTLAGALPRVRGTWLISGIALFYGAYILRSTLSADVDTGSRRPGLIRASDGGLPQQVCTLQHQCIVSQFKCEVASTAVVDAWLLDVDCRLTKWGILIPRSR
jgi:hypothetical protein